MVTPPPSPSPQTIGEWLAHSSRYNVWTVAVLFQIYCLGFGLALAYVAYKESSRTTTTTNPWLLAQIISWSAYFSVLDVVRCYACLYLPRTPMAVVRKMDNIGIWGVGFLATCGVVLGLDVQDSRVLAACTAVADAFVVGVVALWAWLVRTYGGDNGDDALDGV